MPDFVDRLNTGSYIYNTTVKMKHFRNRPNRTSRHVWTVV